MLYADNEITIDDEGAEKATTAESYGIENVDYINFREVIDSDENGDDRTGNRCRATPNHTSSEIDPLTIEVSMIPS